MQALVTWKNKKGHKPLILRGARQVGKTWLLQEFGKLHYAHVVYVNFDSSQELHNLFVPDMNPRRIIEQLSFFFNVPITAGDTLIIFDEIQSVPRGLNALKYFCEQAPEFDVAAAGSLLGMHTHPGDSFPVGKVDFLDLRPLSFTEFLKAGNQALIARAIENGEIGKIDLFHDRLVQLLKVYMFVGGMPEAVATWLAQHTSEAVREVQRNILNAYQADFSKHVPLEHVPRMNLVWDNIPAQLAKENKKFVYGALRPGARARDFEVAITWLCQNGLLLPSHRVSKPGMPLSAYQDMAAFKLFLVDVGLLSAKAGLDAAVLLQGDSIFTEFKGAITEQFVMQELTAAGQNFIGYWTNERSTSEVDFVVQRGRRVFPIEVKAEVNVHAKSFKLFCQKFMPDEAYRASLRHYHAAQGPEQITSLPLYAVGML